LILVTALEIDLQNFFRDVIHARNFKLRSSVRDDDYDVMFVTKKKQGIKVKRCNSGDGAYGIAV